MPIINNSTQTTETVESLLALDKLIAAGTGIDGEVDYVIYDGSDHWRLRTVAAGDDTIVNEAIIVVQVGEDITEIQSFAPPP